MEESATQGDMEAKREMAKRLLKGDGVETDEAKAVSLLEDCVAHGDHDAMVMLAKCCALGCGMERNAELAEELLSNAGKKGNEEAQRLMQIINHCKGKQSIDLEGLQKCFLVYLKKEARFDVVSCRACLGRTRCGACCCCDEHRSLSNPQIETSGMRKDIACFLS